MADPHGVREAPLVDELHPCFDESRESERIPGVIPVERAGHEEANSRWRKRQQRIGLFDSIRHGRLAYAP
jgi:hypothetical protein